MLRKFNSDILFKDETIKNMWEEVVVSVSMFASDIYGCCKADISELLMLK